MSETEILQKQVDALEKLINIKEAIIAEQENRIRRLESQRVDLDGMLRNSPSRQFQPYQPNPGIWGGGGGGGMQSVPFIGGPGLTDPSRCPSDGGIHEYDQIWSGTQLQQPCKKCGCALGGFTITSSNNTVKIDVV